MTLSDLLAQKDSLERQIREAQAAAKAAAIAEVHQLMAQSGLTVADLSAAPKPNGGVRVGSKVAAKYRDPVTGSTWTGRGLKPKWLSAAIANGKVLGDFAI